MHDDAKGPAWPNLDSGLDVEIFLRDLLASLIDAILGRITDGQQQIALPANGKLAAHAKQCGDGDTFDERPGMEINLIFQAGIPGRVRCRQVVYPCTVCRPGREVPNRSAIPFLSW